MEHLGSEGNNSKPTIGSGGGGSDSQTDGSSSGYAIRGRRLSQQFSASAYLVPAFNACATGPNSNGSSPTDVDASLLRYTRPHLFSNSSSSDERPLLRQFLHLRSSLGSSDSSLSPAGMTPTPPGRSPTVFCTPAKGAVLEDGVLVINDDPQGDNRVCHAATRRLLAVGPCSGNSNTNNVRSGGGGGYLHRVQGRRSFDDEGYAMDYQMMGWLSNASQIKQFSRNRPLPSPSPPQSSASEDPFPMCAINTGAEVHPRRMRTTEGDERPFMASENTPPPPPPPPPSTSTFDWPPSEEEEAELERILYGPRRWRRLPVFALICPED